MKISCIIPTCNRTEYLLETLSSVLAQSEAPHEIIVVNNGVSPVTLPENIKNRVKIYDIVPFAGVAQARNFGASLANGDYLAFLDDDDLWNTDYLKNIKVTASDGPTDCIVSRLDWLVNNEIKLYKNAHDKITINNILITNPGINGSNIVIKKKAFLKLGGFDPKLPPSEDKSLILEAIINNLSVKTLPNNQVIWRMHDGASRLTSSNRMAEGIFQFTRKYCRLMNRRQYLYNWKKIYSHRHKSGKKFAYIQYLAAGAILKLMKLASFNKKI